MFPYKEVKCKYIYGELLKKERKKELHAMEYNPIWLLPKFEPLSTQGQNNFQFININFIDKWLNQNREIINKLNKGDRLEYLKDLWMKEHNMNSITHLDSTTTFINGNTLRRNISMDQNSLSENNDPMDLNNNNPLNFIDYLEQSINERNDIFDDVIFYDTMEESQKDIPYSKDYTNSHKVKAPINLHSGNKSENGTLPV